jgi:argininosuccinate synthase
MIREINDLSNLKNDDVVVLLYSGGLDSTYLLTYLLIELKCQVIALTIDVGQTDNVISAPGFDRVKFVELDCKKEFSEEFILKAIHNNGRYLGHHPLSASLSRPLFAKKAIEIAHMYKAKGIIHTAVSHQNSLRRFNNALRDLGFEGLYGSPFELGDISRSVKISYLRDNNIDVCESRALSFDSNLWATECEGDGPDCRSIKTYPNTFLNEKSIHDELDLVIDFESGIPRKLNGEFVDLVDLIENIKTMVEGFEVGQYISYEENPQSEKMLEIKKCPAADILMKCYWAFLNKFLSHDHLMIKNQLDQVWSKEASEGRWYGALKKDIEEFNKSISKGVNCSIQVKIRRSNILIVGVEKSESIELKRAS